MGLALKEKINLLVIGITASFLLFFILYVLFANILSQSLEKLTENNEILLIIVLGIQLISFIAAILVGFWADTGVNSNVIIKASIFAFLSNILFITAISYSFLFILYPGYMASFSPGELLLYFPSILIQFSIYVLGHPIYLALVSIISYFGFYILFIEKFYKINGLKRWKK